MFRSRRSWNRLIGVGVLAALLLIGFGCDHLKVTRYYERGVVASVSPIAAEVGRKILSRGGNAVDAAVAVGFTLAVTYPQAGNLGGGGFAVVRDGASGEIQALDFRETAAAAAVADMYLDDNGEPLDSLSTRGSLAAGVPGTVAGLRTLWEKYGSLPWPELVTVAARLADTGFVVDDHLAEAFVDYRESLSRFEETRELFYPAGVAARSGDSFIQPDLARCLYLIASSGPEVFYTGEIADSLVACMEKHGGLITRADLAQYRPVWRTPIHFTFDSLDIYSAPPPSSGGIMLGQILKLVEPYDFSRFTPGSPEYIHLFSEACRLAYADRSAHLGDPDFYDVPSALLNDDYLAMRRDKIPADHAGRSSDVQPGNPIRYDSDETTHYSICDSEGTMVAVTTTLNSYFGSGLVVSGTGFLLNNEMDDFSTQPGHPNLYGLVGGEANKIEPGKRMLSSMTPTLILKDQQPFLVLGSPGGSKIITTVAQAILGYTRFGLTLEEVVEQPRFHHQWLPDKIYLEKGGFDVATIQRLIRYGHEVEERSRYGDLEIVSVSPLGLVSGASDSRRGGAAIGCDVPTVN